jgi:hypothetical protein
MFLKSRKGKITTERMKRTEDREQENENENENNDI